MSSEIQKLISRYVDQTITPEQFERLDERLNSDRNLRREFLEYMNVCSVIECESDTVERPAPLIPFPSSEKNRPYRKNRKWGWSIAAAASIAITFSFWIAYKTSSDTAVVARVIEQGKPNSQNEDLTFQTGNKVSIEKLNLSSGWLRLELPRGVVFDIYGPAKGYFENEQRFHLTSGRLNVDVGSYGKGFTVITDGAEIVDLGTNFGIEAEEGSNAKVAVFSGEVEVHSKEKRHEPRLLTEGEGVLVSSTGASSRLMSMNIAREGYEENKNALIDIQDNLSDEKSLRYYGIVNGGMGEGAKIYTTMGSVRWQSESGTEFPAELAGADLIQTFHNDRRVKELEIDLNVSQPATVYLMFDERYDTPEWIKNHFVDTGMTIRSGPWKPVQIVHDIIPDKDGNFWVRHKVWSAQTAPGTPLKLGSQRHENYDTRKRAMYGIAVRPRMTKLTELAATKVNN